MHLSRITKNGYPVSQGQKNKDSQIMEKINAHSKCTQGKIAFSHHEKSIGKPCNTHKMCQRGIHGIKGKLEIILLSTLGTSTNN